MIKTRQIARNNMSVNNVGEQILTATVSPQVEAIPAVLPAKNAIHLKIDGVCCAFKCPGAEDYRKLMKIKRLFRGFLTQQPADIIIELEGTDRLSPEDLNTALSEFKYIHEENLFRSTSQAVAGKYDLARRYIKITGERSLANPEMEGNHLNQLLALAYYSACKLKYNGRPPAMIVHACGILRSGQVMLFTGPSDAGKTTIARFCRKRDGEVINDEMLLVSSPDQYGNSVNVESAPFLGRVSSRRNVKAPLRCIFLLKKGDKTMVHNLDRTEAYLKLMRQIITPAYIGQKDKRAVISLMSEFCDDLTKAIPVYELEFNLDEKSLWRVLGELEK
jgi:hypothetical protein